MVYSMTGYGQAENTAGEAVQIKVEMRSVNHRYLDISIRMPRDIQALEDKVRRAIQQALGRGRIDVYISWRTAADDSVCVTIDRTLLSAYARALDEMAAVCALHEKPDLDLLTRLPDVLRVEKTQLDLDEAWIMLASVVDEAAANLSRERLQEGRRLSEDIAARLVQIEKTAADVAVRAPLIVDEYRRKLEERLKEYLGQAEIDPARLLTEAAVFADRSNVTEELVRLGSHLQGFRQALREKGPVGRKLDFMTQELFREVNTIGSKANDYEVARLVVDMKAELEKIREQVQNIE